MRSKLYQKRNVRWALVGYDVLVYGVVALLMLVLYEGYDKLSASGAVEQIALSALCIFSIRFWGNIYRQVWRYGGIQCYIRLLFTDAIAFWLYASLEMLLPMQRITFARMLSLVSLNLLGALALRMLYRFAYKCGNQNSTIGRVLTVLLKVFAGVKPADTKEIQKIKIAIIV